MMHWKILQAGTSRGKKKIYLVITVVLLLLLAVTAILLLHRASERRTEDYTRKARESYSAGDYENALLYLRRIKDEDKNTEILLLMADCYEALENYPRALETLRKLNTADPAISNRIQSIEQRKLQKSQAQMVTIAGVELSVSEQSAILDGLELNDAQLQQLTALYALDRLSLRDNKISDPTALSQLKSLDELDLAGNQIRNIRALTELSSLRTLNLDRNPLTDCTELGSLRFLTSLSIVDTGLDETAVYALAESLPDCAIRFGTAGEEKLFFTGEAFPLNAMELSLSQKNLSDISMLQGFTELKILDLSGNEISDIRPLMELSKLEKLNINNNAVSDMRPLIGLPYLVKLDAEYNRISETTSAGSMTQLTELNLRGNPIKDFSGLGHLTSLKTLDLRDTPVTDADLAELYGMKSIFSIDLRDNKGLSDIAVGALKSALPGCSIALPELIYEVDFSGHHLRSDEKQLLFPAAGISDLSGIAKMTALEEVDLRDNEIMNLFPFEITASAATIRKLNLSGNQIRDVLSLYALSALEELDLSGNEIEAVASLRKLTNLKKLVLTGNPLADEAVQELRGFMPDCEIIF